MSLMESIDSCIRKYSDFKGRASRSEYWWFWGFYVSILIGIPLLLFIVTEALDTASSPSISGIVLIVIYFLSVLGLLIPFIAVSVRRLHDSGLSGWHVLWRFLPYIGWIVIFVLMLRKTKK